MAITNPDKVVTKQDLADFYQELLPYLGGNLPVMGEIDKSDIYSTTEKVVGCWTDGRPVYQKTFNYTMPNVSTDGTRTVGSFVAIGASVGTVVDIQATLYSASASTYDVVNYVDKLTESTDTYRKYTRFFVVNNSASSNKNTLCALCNDISFSGATAYVTLQYTKTTDAANSYNYADENDYSTTEKIVGTWIDGSTLYQKTYSFTCPTCETAGVDAATSSTSALLIGTNVTARKIDGVILQSNGNVHPLPITNSETATVSGATKACITRVFTIKSGTSVYIGASSGRTASNSGTIYVTVQYTK